MINMLDCKHLSKRNTISFNQPDILLGLFILTLLIEVLVIYLLCVDLCNFFESLQSKYVCDILLKLFQECQLLNIIRVLNFKSESNDLVLIIHI